MKIENITDSDMVDPWECTCARCGETDLVTRREFVKADGQVYHLYCLIEMMNETIEKLTASLHALHEAARSFVDIWDNAEDAIYDTYNTITTSGSAGEINNQAVDSPP